MNITTQIYQIFYKGLRYQLKVFVSRGVLQRERETVRVRQIRK